MKKTLTLTAALSLLAGPLASGAQAATTLQYWLWDSNQQPAYQQCAAAFTKANPDISIKISQKGWGDYWTAITTGFVSGTAPDVFTDHLAYFPDFASNNQLVDLAPLIAKDKITTKYYPGLKELWAKDGKQYGLPKDWDTVGVFYNTDLLAKAGLKPADLANLTWNPKDGGSWQSTIAKLTKDKSGNNGLSAKFDKKKVDQYGYETSYGAGFNGQTEWSFYAATTGWKYNNGLFGNTFYYDDPRLAQTIQWLADLNLKYGLIPSFQDVSASGGDALFRAGKVAMVTSGSWQINDYTATPALQSRHRAAAQRPQRQAHEHVQRPGRQHLGRQQEPGRGLEVGQVHGLTFLPECHRQERRGLSGDSRRRRPVRRRPQGQGRGRLAVFEPGQSARRHLLLPDFRQHRQDQRHHEQRHAERVPRQDQSGGLAQRRQRQGQRAVQVTDARRRLNGPLSSSVFPAFPVRFTGARLVLSHFFVR